MKEKLLSLLEKDGKYIARRFTLNWFEKYNPTLIKDILVKTNNLNENTSFPDRIQYVLNEADVTNICRVCGNITKWDRNEKRFQFYCNKVCQDSDPNISRMMIERSKKRDNVVANEKRKNTLLEKFGVEYNSQRQEVKDILSQTVSDRYLSEEQKSSLNSIDWMNQKYNIEKLSMQYISYLLKVDITTVANRCVRYGFTIRKNQNRSSGEKDLSSILESLNINVINSHVGIFNDNREVDIFLPNFNIAIEYCGERYHNDMMKNRSYHYDKWKECHEKNIQLITIFESEWLSKKDIILNFIKTKCNLGKPIYARKCVFTEIQFNEARNFINLHHIQGNKQNITHAFGLKHNDELVGVVTYGKHHRNNSDVILNRLCFKNEYIVIGGTNKLLKNSLKQIPQDITTWSDNRWSTGKIYENAGFKFDGDLKEDYYYTDDNLLYSKQKFKNIDKKYNETEYDVLSRLGYKRIWDCGKKRWKFSQKNRAN